MPDDKMTIGSAVALNSAPAPTVPIPPNDAPGIRAELDALQAMVAALAVRVSASEARDSRHAVILADLCSTLCSFLTQPESVMAQMRDIADRAKVGRS